MDYTKEIDRRGAFRRTPSALQNAVSLQDPVFLPERGRYRLFLAKACPWCHTVEMVLRTKGLYHDVVQIQYVDSTFGEIAPGIRGWIFSDKVPYRFQEEDQRDPQGPQDQQKEGEDGSNGSGSSSNNNNAPPPHSMMDVYHRYLPTYAAKATVPLLVDTKTKQLVCNESAVLCVSFNDQFNELASAGAPNLLPPDLTEDIERWKTFLYEPIRNGVYKVGFAQSQEAYDASVTTLFSHLDQIEEHLASHRFLCGDRFTLVDIFLFATLVRFDSVYHTHFKCTLRRIADYPNISNYSREIYQMETIRPSVDLKSISQHYYTSHKNINPYGIVPVLPAYDWEAPHNRSSLSSAGKATSTGTGSD